MDGNYSMEVEEEINPKYSLVSGEQASAPKKTVLDDSIDISIESSIAAVSTTKSGQTSGKVNITPLPQDKIQNPEVVAFPANDNVKVDTQPLTGTVGQVAQSQDASGYSIDFEEIEEVDKKKELTIPTSRTEPYSDMKDIDRVMLPLPCINTTPTVIVDSDVVKPACIPVASVINDPATSPVDTAVLPTTMTTNEQSQTENVVLGPDGEISISMEDQATDIQVDNRKQPSPLLSSGEVVQQSGNSETPPIVVTQPLVKPVTTAYVESAAIEDSMDPALLHIADAYNGVASIPSTSSFGGFKITPLPPQDRFSGFSSVSTYNPNDRFLPGQTSMSRRDSLTPSLTSIIPTVQKNEVAPPSAAARTGTTVYSTTQHIPSSSSDTNTYSQLPNYNSYTIPSTVSGISTSEHRQSELAHKYAGETMITPKPQPSAITEQQRSGNVYQQQHQAPPPTQQPPTQQPPTQQPSIQQPSIQQPTVQTSTTTTTTSTTNPIYKSSTTTTNTSIPFRYPSNIPKYESQLEKFALPLYTNSSTVFNTTLNAPQPSNVNSSSSSSSYSTHLSSSIPDNLELRLQQLALSLQASVKPAVQQQLSQSAQQMKTSPVHKPTIGGIQQSIINKDSNSSSAPPHHHHPQQQQQQQQPMNTSMFNSSYTSTHSNNTNNSNDYNTPQYNSTTNTAAQGPHVSFKDTFHSPSTITPATSRDNTTIHSIPNCSTCVCCCHSPSQDVSAVHHASPKQRKAHHHAAHTTANTTTTTTTETAKACYTDLGGGNAQERLHDALSKHRRMLVNDNTALLGFKERNDKRIKSPSLYRSEPLMIQKHCEVGGPAQQQISVRGKELPKPIVNRHKQDHMSHAVSTAQMPVFTQQRQPQWAPQALDPSVKQNIVHGKIHSAAEGFGTINCANVGTPGFGGNVAVVPTIQVNQYRGLGPNEKNALTQQSQLRDTTNNTDIRYARQQKLGYNTNAHLYDRGVSLHGRNPKNMTQHRDMPDPQYHQAAISTLPAGTSLATLALNKQ